MEFQAGRMADPIRTADYEEFVQRYADGEIQPTLAEWREKMIDLYGRETFEEGRIRVWMVTREELIFDGTPGKGIDPEKVTADGGD